LHPKPIITLHHFIWQRKLSSLQNCLTTSDKPKYPFQIFDITDAGETADLLIVEEKKLTYRAKFH